MNKKEDFGSIINKEQVHFKNNKALEKYYEHKWKTEGYSKGYQLFGVNISAMYHESRLKSALKNLDPKSGENILDAGCGEGLVSEEIAKICKKVYAVDIAKSAFNKQRLRRYKNIEFKKMNIEQLSFKDESFDKIVCIETIEHVLDYNKTLSEFHRTLKKGGLLIMSYPIMDNTPIGKFEMMLHIRKKFNVSEHLTDWDYNQVLNIVKTQGFTKLRAEGIAFDLGLLLKLKYVNKFFARKITELQLAITCAPKNSMFVVFVFKKG